jgi:hypothetical protein
MTVQKAKRNPVKGVTTFYVSSRSVPGKKYMVVRFDTPNPLFFCQCSDYFGRRLPHLGQNTFSHCEHIKKARRTK